MIRISSTFLAERKEFHYGRYEIGWTILDNGSLGNAAYEAVRNYYNFAKPLFVA